MLTSIVRFLIRREAFAPFIILAGMLALAITCSWLIPTALLWTDLPISKLSKLVLSMLAGLVAIACSKSIIERFARLLIQATGNGRGLLPDQKTFAAYTFFLPTFKSRLDPRLSVRVEHMLESKDRAQALEGIRISKESGDWHARVHCSLFRFSIPTSLPEPVLEECLRSGVLLPRYNAQFEPILITLGLRSWGGDLYREVVNLLLAYGTDINDENVDGATLLDVMVQRRSTDKYVTQDVVVELGSDIDFVIGLGARISHQAIAQLRTMHVDGPAAQEALDDLVNRMSRVALMAEAQEERPQDAGLDDVVAPVAARRL